MRLTLKIKICNRCGKEFPATTEYFRERKETKNGLRKECKECSSKYDSEYRIKNKKSVINSKKKYYQENKEYVQRYKKEYGVKNKIRIAEYQLNYREDATNKEKASKYNNKYAKENPEKYRVICQRRRAKKQLLSNTLTIQQWENIKKHFNNSCAYCGKKLPLAQEHFLALNEGGEYTINNIIPSCKSCNSSKGTKNFDVWYPKYKHYSKKREKIILKFLCYKGNTQQLKII